MKIRRNNNLLIEPPSVATGDIAFNLLVFFLVCASSQPTTGKKQDIPRAEKQQEQQESKQKLIEVVLTRTTVTLDEEGKQPFKINVELGDGLHQSEALRAFAERVKAALAGKEKPEDRVLAVRSSKDTPYLLWIAIASHIDQVGGNVTLQLQEEREVLVP